MFISGTTPLEKEGDLVELIKVAQAQDASNHIRVVCLGVGKMDIQIILLEKVLLDPIFILKWIHFDSVWIIF